MLTRSLGDAWPMGREPTRHYGRPKSMYHKTEQVDDISFGRLMRMCLHTRMPPSQSSIEMVNKAAAQRLDQSP